MKSRRIIKIVCLGIITSSLFCCKTEEIILHGEIKGIVTDTTTSQPIQSVAIKLNPLNDTTSTGKDGEYSFINLIPGDYSIEASKLPYAAGKRSFTVTSANTKEVDFSLHKIQYPDIPKRHLDFGFDSIHNSFTIRNTGTGKLNYSITSSQDWITLNPNIGYATTETDTIKVTINRTGLSEKKHVESIEVVSHVGLDLVRDTVYVLLNGIIDQDNNYYGIITIGTQTWLAENLNTGSVVNVAQEQLDNEIIEKYCIGSCSIYGGLYQWAEAMDYDPAVNDVNNINVIRGICPVGWHIPNYNEFHDLLSPDMSAGKLKEQGTLHWRSPNTGATNATGFTALPAGYRGTTSSFIDVGERADFWMSGWDGSYYGAEKAIGTLVLLYDGEFSIFGNMGEKTGQSVRCIKDPEKK
jgi:uncharacterized protein (TIGR02145 family)